MSAITTTTIVAGLLLFSPKEQQQVQAFDTANLMSEEVPSLSAEAEAKLILMLALDPLVQSNL